MKVLFSLLGLFGMFGIIISIFWGLYIMYHDGHTFLMVLIGSTIMFTMGILGVNASPDAEKKGPTGIVK
jgi:hypothetical protein